MKSLLNFLRQFESIPYLLMPSSHQRIFLREISIEGIFNPCRFIDENTIHEIVKNQYLVDLKKTFNIDYPLGRRIIRILPFVHPSMNYESSKLKYLSDLKSFALEHHYIQPPMSLPLLDKKIILAYAPTYDKGWLSYNFSIYHPEKIDKKPMIVWKCTDESQQIHAIIENIDKLLENQININQIVIVNAAKDDLWRLKIEARFFGFSISALETEYLDSLPQVITFINDLKNQSLTDSLLSWQKNIDTNSELSIGFDQVQSLIEDYGFQACENDHSLLIYLLSVTPLKAMNLIDTVQCISLEDAFTDSSVHYLVMHYTDASIPKLKKNDDYITDEEKRCLGLWTSYEENECIKEELMERLSAATNVSLYMPENVAGKKMRISDLFNATEIEVLPYKSNISALSASKTYAQLLYAKHRYRQLQFGVFASEDDLLHKTFEDEFFMYDPQFKGLSSATSKQLIKEGFAFSATNLERFNACRFRFLLDYLLKILPSEASEALILGNLAHEILAKGMNDTLLIQAFANQYLEKKKIVLTPRMEVLKDLFLGRLEVIMEYLKTFKTGSLFQDYGFEVAKHYDFPNHPSFSMGGKIDWVRVYEHEGLHHVSVIDFKTGNKSFDMNAFENGVDIQPLFYLNLLKKTTFMKTFSPFSFYYQPIAIKRLSKDKSNQDPLIAALKMDGLTINDSDMIHAFTQSNNINGVNFTFNGLKKNKRLVEPQVLKNMVEQIDGWIDEAILKLQKGDYLISPLAGKNAFDDSPSCQYCPHASICYMANQVKLETLMTQEEGDE